MKKNKKMKGEMTRRLVSSCRSLSRCLNFSVPFPLANVARQRWLPLLMLLSLSQSTDYTSTPFLSLHTEHTAISARAFAHSYSRPRTFFSHAHLGPKTSGGVFTLISGRICVCSLHLVCLHVYRRHWTPIRTHAHIYIDMYIPQRVNTEQLN